MHTKPCSIFLFRKIMFTSPIFIYIQGRYSQATLDKCCVITLISPPFMGRALVLFPFSTLLTLDSERLSLYLALNPNLQNKSSSPHYISWWACDLGLPNIMGGVLRNSEDDSEFLQQQTQKLSSFFPPDMALFNGFSWNGRIHLTSLKESSL